MSLNANDPRLAKLAAALATSKEVAANPNTTPANMEAMMADLRSAQEEANAALSEAEKRSAGDEGDAVRGEAFDRVRFDQRRGHAVVDPEKATAVYPSLKMFCDQLELVSPLPEGAKATPANMLMYQPTNDETIKKFQTVADMVLFGMRYTDEAGTRGKSAIVDLKNQLLRDMSGYLETRADILNPFTAGLGLEWDPAYASAELQSAVFYATVLEPLFGHTVMPRSPMTMPLWKTLPKAHKGTPSTLDSAWQTAQFGVSNPDSGQLTLTAQLLGIIIDISREMEEDSVFAVLPQVYDKVIFALATGIEDAIINGSVLMNDLDNAESGNGDKLWTSAFDVRNAWNGLRKDGLRDGTVSLDCGGLDNNSATKLDVNKLAKLQALMGPYGAGSQFGNLTWIVGPDAYSALLTLRQGTENAVITMERFGPNATVKTGQIGSLMGHPVILSGAMYGPNNGVGLNASGVYDNDTKATTSILLVNTSSYTVGDRRTVQVFNERSQRSGMVSLTTNCRKDFKKIVPDTAPSCVTLYNVIPSV